MSLSIEITSNRRKFLEMSGSFLALAATGALPFNTLAAERNQGLIPSVAPYLVYPADKLHIPEYELALMDGLQAAQTWFQEQIGKTFTITSPLQTITGNKDYLTMRCGNTPNAECVTNPNAVSPTMWMDAIKAITGDTGNSLMLYKNKVIVAALVGSGELSQGGSFSKNTGYVVLGDWYLQAFSGVSNEWGINCSNNPHGGVEGWICNPETAVLGIAHELGHAFGLRHPNEIPNQSFESTIMSGDLAANKFSAIEIALLQQSPFLS